MAEINNIDKAANDDLAAGNATRESILAALEVIDGYVADLVGGITVTASSAVTVDNFPTNYPDSAAIAELTAINAAVSGGGSIALTPATITSLLGALTTANAPIVSGIGTTNSSLTSALSDLTDILLELDHMATDGQGVALTPATIAAIQQVTATILAFPVDYPNASADNSLTSILAAMSLNTIANNAISADLAHLTDSTQKTQITDGANAVGVVLGDVNSVPVAPAVKTVTHTISATGADTAIDTSGYTWVEVVNSAVTSFTFNPQQSYDSFGSANSTKNCLHLSGGDPTQMITSGNVSAGSGITSTLCSPTERYFRLNVTTLTGGPVTVTFVLHASPVPPYPVVTTLSQVTDGTQTANTIAGDTGQNALLGASPTKSVAITTAGASDTVIDCLNYRWGSIQVSTVGTTISFTVQGSNDNTNWVILPTTPMANASPSATIGGITGLSISKFEIPTRYIRIHVTAQTGASPALNVCVFASAPTVAIPPATAPLVSQNGTWTITQGGGQNASPWTTAGKAPVTSLNAAVGTGAGTALDCTGAMPNPTLQVFFPVTPATISINLEGSNDGSHWTVLSTSTSVAAAGYVLQPTAVGVCMRQYRANLTALTGASASVSALISAGG